MRASIDIQCEGKIEYIYRCTLSVGKCGVYIDIQYKMCVSIGIQFEVYRNVDI